MAKMIPPQPPAGTPISERQVFAALAKLPDDWTVLHSVKWQSLRKGRQGDGEADFVLVCPAKGILVVEVKGGDVHIEGGTWLTVNSKTNEIIEINNPFEQATDSKHALLEYLKDHGLPMRGMTVAHAVAFPKLTLSEAELGPAAPPPITWDRPALIDIDRAVQTTCNHWAMKSAMTTAERNKIVQLLAPTVSVRRRLVDEVGDTERRLIQLTDEQKADFALLRRFRRAVVVGGAGTGKTVLAIERARQLALDGFAPLLVCYNELLGEHLASELADAPDVVACTFHSLCFKAAKAAGLTIPSRPDAAWWSERAPDLLIDAYAKDTKKPFRSIVVDEGQDFPTNWLDALELIAGNVPDPPFYVFADANQQLYLDGWGPPANMPPSLELTVNCRSTTLIVERAASVFGRGETGRGVTGPKPQFRDASGRRELTRGIQRFVETLVESEGIDPGSIIVLSDDAIIQGLSTLSAGSVPFVRSGHGVRMETIRRFKGMEAEIVVLGLTDTIDRADLPALAYTGISRARSALYVFGSPAVRTAINWS